MKRDKKGKEVSCCSAAGSGLGCCKVESVITVDERGQMVLPKDVREKADIKAGDKLAVATFGGEKKPCCIFLIKVENLAGIVKNLLGPVMDMEVKR